MVGFVDDTQAREILASSRIFALPSSREGFGLTVAEAMACGLPCILSDLPAFREAFSAAAIFVQGSLPQDWASPIIELLRDEKMQILYSESSKKLAANYKWENVAQTEKVAMSCYK